MFSTLKRRLGDHRRLYPSAARHAVPPVLCRWTQSTAYLLAVAAGVERRNLDGSPAGVPVEDRQAFAQEALRRRGKWPVEVQAVAEAPVVSEQPGGDPT